MALVLFLVVTASELLTPTEKTMVDGIANRRLDLRANLEAITKIPHLAGTDGAEEVAGMYFEMLRGALAAIPNATVMYDNHTALLSFPESASLRVGGVEAKVEEAAMEADPTSNTSWNSKIWNGYGLSGTLARKQAVYANYGRPEDFAVLEAENISVENRIVLVRYGGCFRGIKVREAEMRRASGVLIFSDPADYGGVDSGGDYPANTYTAGPYLPPSGVQRGSVLNLPRCPGNPQGRKEVCGWEERELLPNIPVMPLSAEDAALIMVALDGNQTRPVPEDWRGSLQLAGATYGFGPGPEHIALKVNNTRRNGKVINIIARIPGTLPRADDHPVIIGNHRDAWVFGAADPNSGSVAMVEVARGLANAWSRGWRPQRTVVFGSWDAEELGIIGSTAFAESNAAFVQTASIYINVDTAASGPQFGAGASPSAIDAMVSAAGALDADAANGAIRFELRADQVGALGGGSDYAPFLNHLGVASLNFGFDMPGGYPVYHSIYDSFHWMTQDWSAAASGDPNFDRHVACARLWALLTMRMASSELLPLSVATHGVRFEAYVNAAAAAMQSSSIPTRIIEPLQANATAYRAVTAAFMDRINNATERSLRETQGNNTVLVLNEQAFLNPAGLPDRPWYRNVLMASGIDKGYGADTLPGLAQAIASNDSELAQSEIKTIQACLAESFELMRDGVLPPVPQTGPGADEAVGDTIIVLLSLGLPVFVVATVYLSRLFSATPPEASEALLARSRAQSPVHVETDDGTSTEV